MKKQTQTLNNLIAQLVKWKELEPLPVSFPSCPAALRDLSSNEVGFCANMLTLLPARRPPGMVISYLCSMLLFSKQFYPILFVPYNTPTLQAKRKKKKKRMIPDLEMSSFREVPKITKLIRGRVQSRTQNHGSWFSVLFYFLYFLGIMCVICDHEVVKIDSSIVPSCSDHTTATAWLPL